MRTKRKKTHSRRKQRTARRSMKGGEYMNKAGILLYDNINKKILTVSNQFDQNIAIPKGKMEPGESLLETAFRELTEETGIIFNELPAIVKQFNVRPLHAVIFVVLFPNGSETVIDYTNPREHIYHVKWRSKQDLAANVDHANLSIRKNNYILEPIIQLFSTNYTETTAPSVTMVNHVENTDLDALITVDTHTV